MIIAEVMTRDPQAIGPDDTVHHAAELMSRLDVGALPVCNDGRLVGLVTGRDLADRTSAAGRAPESTRICEVMTGEVRWAHEQDDTEAAGLLMSDLHVRRLPIVDAEKKLIGIVSLRDLACGGTSAAEQIH